MSNKPYKIYLKLSEKELLHDNENSLLDKLEQHGIYHEYQCRSGYCGSCRVKINHGKVSYPNPPLAFTRSNEILLCCCKVESDLEIEY